MGRKIMTLRDLKAGESAVIETVGGEGSLRQHFLDMGVIPGAEITLEKFAPMGDPMELRIHSYELTLRLADAEKNRSSQNREKRESKTGNFTFSGGTSGARRKRYLSR